MLILRSQTSFLDSVDLGCTQREYEPNEKKFDNTTRCLTPYFSWSNRELTRMGQTSHKNFNVVLRYGMTCSKMRGTVLRVSKPDGATVQSFLSLLGRSPNKKRFGKMNMKCQKFAAILLVFVSELDILWPINNLARSVTKWTQACDRRLAR